jgi:hypothetical protein
MDLSFNRYLTEHALMSAGLHGLSGLNPRASIHLINCYVIPRFLYGLDVIQLTASDVKNLNVYFNKLIIFLNGINWLKKSHRKTQNIC